jgi:uncharacterized membrane protein
LATRDFPALGAPAIFDPVALLATTGLLLLFVVVAALQVPWVLIPLGLFVLFVAPGYGAVALLFGERTVPSLAANIAMIVGFSVVINVVLGTLLLFFAIAPLAPLVGAAAAVICAAATVVQYRRPHGSAPGHRMRRLRSYFELAGFSSRQRVAAYALFVGILLTFGAIGYLSTVQPGNGPDLSLAVVGPDGTTSTLPTSGSINGTLYVVLLVQNNETAQSLVLGVNSSLVGQNATNFTTVTWGAPLALGPNVTASTVLELTSGEKDNVAVSFQFGLGGDYLVSFSLTPPQSHLPVRTSGIAVRIV